jgi:hypothetical protein
MAADDNNNNRQDSSVTVAVIQSEMRHLTAMMDAMALEISQLRTSVNQMMSGVVLRPTCDIIHAKDDDRLRLLERRIDVLTKSAEDRVVSSNEIHTRNTNNVQTLDRQMATMVSTVDILARGVTERNKVSDGIHANNSEDIRALERKLDVMTSYVEDLRTANKSDQWVTRLMSAGAVLAAYMLTKVQLP